MPSPENRKNSISLKELLINSNRYVPAYEPTVEDEEIELAIKIIDKQLSMISDSEKIKFFRFYIANEFKAGVLKPQFPFTRQDYDNPIKYSNEDKDRYKRFKYIFEVSFTQNILLTEFEVWVIEVMSNPNTQLLSFTELEKQMPKELRKKGESIQSVINRIEVAKVKVAKLDERVIKDRREGRVQRNLDELKTYINEHNIWDISEQEVCNMLGISERTLSVYLSKLRENNDIPSNFRLSTAGQNKHMVKQYIEEGLTTKEIADLLGLNISSVQYIRNKLDLAAPTMKEIAERNITKVEEYIKETDIVSPSQIARSLEMPLSTVERALRKIKEKNN